MANYSALIKVINNQIKANGNQEITGPVLNAVLQAIVSGMSEGALFAGIADTTTNPPAYDGNVFYIAIEPGNYSNFGVDVPRGSIGVLHNMGGGNKWDVFPINTYYTIDVDTLMQDSPSSDDIDEAIGGFTNLKRAIIAGVPFFGRSASGDNTVAIAQVEQLSANEVRVVMLNTGTIDGSNEPVPIIKKIAVNAGQLSLSTEAPTSFIGPLSSLGTNEKGSVVGAINEVNTGLKSAVKPYIVDLTDLLAAQDSESISTAIGGIDNLNGTVQKNQVIFGILANGTVAVGIRVLGNQTTLTYFVDSVVGLTVNEIIITNTSGTLTKTANTHAVLTENMVVDNLESDEATLPLSAAQGKVLATDKQDKTDESLQTSDKTVAGAINEVNQAVKTKQDKLKAGTGVEITSDNTVNVTLDTTEAIEIKKEYNHSYIRKGIARIAETTSQRAVAVYEIVPNSKLRLHIPKNGNSYSTTYIYLNNLDDKIGVLPSDGGIEGSETEINFEFTAENYGFLAVTYTTTDGKPTLSIIIESKYTDVAKVKDLIAQEIDKIKPQLFIDGVDLFLPNKFYAVKNDTLQIFIKSIVKAKDPYIFDVIGKCQVGNMYPRYYVLPKTTANNNIGNTFDVEFVVRNNNLNDIVRKTSQLQVLDFPQSPSSNKNVLCVGASATAGGQWVFELNRRLTGVDGDGTALNPTGLGLTNISFVGRKTGYSKAIKLEATGGWAVSTYAGKGRQAFRFFVNNVSEINVEDVYRYGTTNFTIAEINVTEGVGNISCLYSGTVPTLPTSGVLEKVTGSGDAQIEYQSYESEYYNPFYNNETSKLDFTTYANSYCDGSIDYFVWHCGVNGIFGGNDAGVESEINSFKTILRAFHEDFPSSKVIISSVPIGSPTGGFGANYGTSLTSNYYTFLKQAMNYARALIELCAEEEFSPYTYYCPVMEEFDCENSYPASETDVNNRVDVKEKLGTNGVHPTDVGYKLVADAMYRTMCYVLSL